MPAPPLKVALAALLLSACATGRPPTGSSFDLYYEAVDLFPVAYECIQDEYEKEIERRQDRARAVKEWLSAKEPQRTAERDEELRSREGFAHPPICASASNGRYKERRRVASILAELERRMRQDEPR